MIKLAIADFFSPDFPVKIDEKEIENGQSIPTAYLMDEYRQKHPDIDFWFVMGTDLISGLHSWEEGDRLVSSE